MKKQIRAKEADFQKTKAVLEQHVELLRLQVEESQEREENLKKVQVKMLTAFGDGSGSSGDASH